MAQRRFWNWRDDDLTADINQWLQGILESGRYRGYDAKVGTNNGGSGTVRTAGISLPNVIVDAIPSVGMTLTLSHLDTGSVRVDKNEQWTDKFGVVVTKQGTVVQEYDNIELPISTTNNGFHRFDLIVINHQYSEIPGGEQGIYSVIEGVATHTNIRANVPSLPNQELQTVLGVLYLTGGTTDLQKNGVYYTPSDSPNFANSVAFIEKAGGFFITDLDANSNKIVNLKNPTESQDAATKYYVDQSIANNVVWASELNRGIAKILKANELISQLPHSIAADNSKIITLRRWKEAYNLNRATQSQANGNIESYKFVTPKTLANRTATESRKGLARIATTAEALLGQDDTTIITPRKLKQALPLIPKVIEIGDWDLTTSATINIPHLLGADWDKVISIDALIIEDNQSTRNKPDIENIKVDTTNVEIILTGYVGDYNATGVNRGFITFWIKKDLPPVQNVLIVNAGSDYTESGSFTEGSQMSTPFDLIGFVEAIGSPLDQTTWSIQNQPAGSNIIIANENNLNTTITVDFYGSYTIELEAENDDGDIVVDTITITIEEQANTAPVINHVLGTNYAQQDPSWVNPDGLLASDGWKHVSLGINATDADGDTLSYTVTQVQSWNPLDGTFGPPVINSNLHIIQDTVYPHVFDVRNIALDFANIGSGGNGDGSWFLYLKCEVDDGNGGTAVHGFKTKVVPFGVYGNSDPFTLGISPDANPSSLVFDGFITLNPVTDVASLEATIVAPDIPANSFDVVLQMGSGSGQFMSVGSYLINPNLFASAIPFTFTLSDSQSFPNGATVTFRARNLAGSVIGFPVSVYVHQ